MRHVHAIARSISDIMAGRLSPDPVQHGLTSEEERIASNMPQVGLAARLRPISCIYPNLYKGSRQYFVAMRLDLQAPMSKGDSQRKGSSASNDAMLPQNCTSHCSESPVVVAGKTESVDLS